MLFFGGNQSQPADCVSQPHHKFVIPTFRNETTGRHTDDLVFVAFPVLQRITVHMVQTITNHPTCEFHDVGHNLQTAFNYTTGICGNFD